MKEKTFTIRSKKDKAAATHHVTFEGDLGIGNAPAIRKKIMSLNMDGDKVTLQLYPGFPREITAM